MVKTDSKYSFSKFALSISLVMRFELSDLSGATPESMANFFVNEFVKCTQVVRV